MIIKHYGRHGFPSDPIVDYNTRLIYATLNIMSIKSTLGLEALRNSSVLLAVQAMVVLWRFVARLLPDTQIITLIQKEPL